MVIMLSFAMLLCTIFTIPGSGYIPIAADKAHARIIWDCGWAIEGDVFATASRDKTVLIVHAVLLPISHPYA